MSQAWTTYTEEYFLATLAFIIKFNFIYRAGALIINSTLMTLQF